MRIEQVGSATILEGDALVSLHLLDDQSAHCCITSPPYFGLRDYGVSGQIGLEPTLPEYIAKLVSVFREVRRVLRDDGTLWLNLGDSYAGSGRGGLKPKDLLGVPWAVAFALRADGWYLRQQVPWVKRNPMPESVRDRPTSSVETWFLFSKNEKYYYDYEAVQRRMAESTLNDKRLADPEYQADRVERGQTGGAQHGGGMLRNKQRGHSRKHDGFNARWDGMTKEEQGQTRAFRNCDLFYESLTPPHRGITDDTGEILALDCATQPFRGAHFATFPPKLIAPLMAASCPVAGVVLDVFAGAGTTGVVAQEQQKHSVLLELNPEYVDIIMGRLSAL